jgi:hypothetical protein
LRCVSERGARFLQRLKDTCRAFFPASTPVGDTR